MHNSYNIPCTALHERNALNESSPNTSHHAHSQGSPLFVVHRTEDMIASAKKDDAIMATLRDPATDGDRCPNPEWLVCMGVCTHLGCQPTYQSGDYGAFFCSCHGSHYDWSGRIRRGPAPLNLQVPGYGWADDKTIAVG